MKLVHRIRPRPVVLAVLAVGLLATVLGSVAVHRSARRSAHAWVARQADVVREQSLQTVAEVIEDLEAVSAFLETAPGVGKEEFGEFVSRIDGSVRQIGVAYSSVVRPEDVEDFLASARSDDPSYQISVLSDDGELVAANFDGDSTVYPIEFFVPGGFLQLALDAAGIPDSPTLLAVGLDAGATSDWLPSLEATVSGNTAMASDFMDLTYANFGVPKLFFVTVPVHDDDGVVTGVVAAPMVEVLLSLGGYTSREVSWDLGSMGAAPVLETSSFMWTGPVDLPGVTWQLTLAPSEEKEAELLRAPTRLIVLIGLLVTALLATLAHLTLQRRSARTRLDSLQRLADEKDRFLAAVSHEIRTPLTTVHGLAHELAERPDDFDADEAASLLELVVEQADEVSAIVEDLLVAARTDIGKVNLYPAVIDVADEVRDVLAGMPDDVSVSGTAAPAWADGRRVRQILRNLLTNAQRYGGPRVEVRLSADGEWISVTVADSGPAIPDEHQRRIFDPYTSAHEGSPQVGSIGLGLFISRKLANVMGGELKYEHDGAVGGFTLVLPRAASGDGELREAS